MQIKSLTQGGGGGWEITLWCKLENKTHTYSSSPPHICISHSKVILFPHQSDLKTYQHMKKVATSMSKE